MEYALGFDGVWTLIRKRAGIGPEVLYQGDTLEDTIRYACVLTGGIVFFKLATREDIGS